MKSYRLYMIITCLSYNIQADAFWQKWIDTISSKIYNSTDTIVHKEFKNAHELELNNENGTIVINSWKQDLIAIEIITSSAQSSHKDIKCDIEFINGIVKIHTIFIDEKIKGSVIFNILLPKKTPLAITTKKGDIIIKDVINNLNLKTGNGTIKLINPHGNINAMTENGNIFIRTNLIDHNKEFNVKSDKGNIEIYTIDTIDTYLDAYAPQGKITSELPITLDSQTTLLNADAWKNFKQIVHGSIGKTLSKTILTAHNGSIAILPYMKQNNIV